MEKEPFSLFSSHKKTMKSHGPNERENTMNTKIQLVEDDADFSAAIKLILEKRGYDCYTADTARTGLHMVNDINPDLILLDIMMEDPSAGFWFIQKLKKNGSSEDCCDIPIIILSSIKGAKANRVKNRLGTYLLPVEDFIQKPVQPDVLVETIQKVIQSKNSVLNSTCECVNEKNHFGPVRRYHIYDPATQTDFGGFNYCEKCAMRDQIRGFVVRRI